MNLKGLLCIFRSHDWRIHRVRFKPFAYDYTRRITWKCTKCGEIAGPLTYEFEDADDMREFYRRVNFDGL